VIRNLFTIGGYGHTIDSFFNQLQRHGVDLLVDIRQRRGMRGSAYAFLNATALQRELRIREIDYLHLKVLAPTTSIRNAQKAADKIAESSKRDRTYLSESFTSAYKTEVLGRCDASQIIKEIGTHSNVCFFCVEGPSTACHRSLVSNWIADNTGVRVVHIGSEK
jgi:uncharacterized protein (DUF488 family)